MTDWKTDDWERTDWERTDLMISIEAKEREAKVLKERKMVEEADAALTEELFSNEEKEEKEEKEERKERKEKVYNFKPIIIIKKKKPKELLEQRKQQLKEKQKFDTQNLRDQMEKKMRSNEVYGEAEADMYEDTYGKIEDTF